MNRLKGFLTEIIIPKLPWLLLLGIPLGAGSQNIVLAIVTTALLIANIGHKMWNFRGHLIIVGSLLIWLAIATMINPANPGDQLVGHLLGFAPFALLPCLIPHAKLNGSPRLWKCLIGVIVFIALVALSQYFFGWERDGLNIVNSEFRARGTWTHPLTLAYASLLILPFATGWILQYPYFIGTWGIFLAEVVIIWTSKSRVVVLLSIAMVGLQVLISAPKKFRLTLIGLLIATVAGVAYTDNEISRHFKRTIAGQVDRHTDRYPDDRVAFWHAHWYLFKQRPMLGHDIHVPRETREQAYAAIDLESFPKKYTAHNQFLQLLVEGGVPAILIFCAFFAYWWYQCWQHRKLKISTWMGLCLGGFALGLITQNALQDNEVRYVLTLLLVYTACQFTNAKQTPEIAGTRSME